MPRYSKYGRRRIRLMFGGFWYVLIILPEDTWLTYDDVVGSDFKYGFDAVPIEYYLSDK